MASLVACFWEDPNFCLRLGEVLSAISMPKLSVLLYAHYSRRFKLIEKSVWLRDGLDLGLETVTTMYDGISGNKVSAFARSQCF